MENEKKWGGRREGSGRRAKGVVTVSVCLRESVAERVALEAAASGRSKSTVVDDALAAFFKL